MQEDIVSSVSSSCSDSIYYSQNVINELQEQIKELSTQNELYYNALNDAFTCLIKANVDNIITDTLWVGNFTTLWDLFMQTLNISEDEVRTIEKEYINKE